MQSSTSTLWHVLNCLVPAWQVRPQRLNSVVCEQAGTSPDPRVPSPSSVLISNTCDSMSSQVAQLWQQFLDRLSAFATNNSAGSIQDFAGLLSQTTLLMPYQPAATWTALIQDMQVRGLCCNHYRNVIHVAGFGIFPFSTPLTLWQVEVGQSCGSGGSQLQALQLSNLFMFTSAGSLLLLLLSAAVAPKKDLLKTCGIAVFPADAAAAATTAAVSTPARRAGIAPDSW